MKWIKYQIRQCVVGDVVILANKKIGYSEANLAIAEAEAYDGYQIFDDGKPEPKFEKIPTKVSELENDAGYLTPDDEVYSIDSQILYMKNVHKGIFEQAEIEQTGGMTYKVNVGTEEEPVYKLQHTVVTAVESVWASDIIDTLAIPEFVQALDSYGCGISDKYYNYIDWVQKQYSKRVSKLILDGSENWEIVNIGKDSAYFKLELGPKGSVIDDAILCNRYGSYNVSSSNKGVGIRLLNSSTSNVAMISLRPENVANMTLESWLELLRSWQSDGNSLEIIYALSEILITDISHILLSNFIKVKSGCVVKMLNEFNHAVPSTIKYYNNVLNSRITKQEADEKYVAKNDFIDAINKAINETIGKALEGDY